MSGPPNFTNWGSHGETFTSRVNDTYPFISASNAGTMNGKAMLVTGASRGIGQATAVHFAKAGCSMIALAARTSLAETEAAVKKAAQEAGSEVNVLALKMDVTSPSSIGTAFKAVKGAFERLDVLINNAGYMPKWAPIGDLDPKEYRKTVDIDLNGAYFVTRYFLPLLVESQLKVVINVTSIGAHAIFPGSLPYSVSKFGLCRFTEFLQEEYGHQGLIAMAVHPAGVKTELALEMPEYMHAFLSETVELPADTLLWLAKERKDWLGGRYIHSTWNMEELEKRKGEIVERDMLKFRMVL